MPQLHKVTTLLIALTLSACVSSPYSTPSQLRFQDQKHGKNTVLQVIRDEKLCADDKQDKQNCPINFYIDDINSGHFYINNKADFFLKNETYNFKVKNCTDKCSVCETDFNPSELSQRTIKLTVDEQGLPFMLGIDNQLLCKPLAEKVSDKVANAVEMTTTLNLAADTLFKFDRSSLNDLLPKGRAEVVDVANKIANNYVKVSKIILTGHTDRLGNDFYNYNLGEKRAQTVRQLMIAHGVPATIIQYKSEGETKPVTDGCFNVIDREALKACLQPDRRVTVEITGISK